MSQNAKFIVQKIKDSLGVKNDKEFCEMIDIEQSTLSMWKKADTLDFNKIISLCERNDLDINEVFFPENGFVSETEPVNDVEGFYNAKP